MTPRHLQLESETPVIEKNGFTILDVTPDSMRVRLLAWRSGDAPAEAIDRLEPYHDVEIGRRD